MCGICGTFWTRTGRPAQRELVGRMCQRMIHRGPDDDGFHADGDLALGMRRLSIIDLAQGHQPIFNEDQSVAVVQNGEIYNFQDLRLQLVQRGHRFATSSDTETIVHLYEEYGLDFPSHLNGMFSIALWDAKLRRLVLVRDRLGKKPLYYAWTRDGLIFGSELKCLTVSDEISLDIDPAAVYHFFTLGYIPHPHSIYRQVQQLPPAHRLVVQEGQLSVERYWQVPEQIDDSLDMQEAAERLRSLLSDAVRLRMASDVPLGAFLSGGLDSSIVVALMAQQSADPVKTFHIDFAEPRYSEREYARAVASKFGTDHHELRVEASAIDVLDNLVDAFDEPFGDASAIPTYYVSQLTRQHVTVALAGDGGDESFGGYKRYHDILARRNLMPLVRAGLGAAGRAVHRCLPRNAPGRRYFRSLGMNQNRFFAVGVGELETRELLSPDYLGLLNGVSSFDLIRPDMQRAAGHDPLARFAMLDLCRYLPDDILTKVDRMSMAHSLELRAPLLDYRLVEFAATVPSRLKIAHGESKVVLKRAFADLLPEKVLEQRKRGFSPPVEQWLRDELRPMLDEALHDPTMRDSGIFRPGEMQALAEEHYSGRRGRRSILWRYLFFTRWYHRHISQSALPSDAATTN